MGSRGFVALGLHTLLRVVVFLDPHVLFSAGAGAVCLDCDKLPQTVVNLCRDVTLVAPCSAYKLVFDKLCYRICKTVNRQECANRDLVCAECPDCAPLCLNMFELLCETTTDAQAPNSASVTGIGGAPTDPNVDPCLGHALPSPKIYKPADYYPVLSSVNPNVNQMPPAPTPEPVVGFNFGR